jgi:transposase InsO family protein
MMLSGHGLSRSELWSRLEDIELATLEWIWWLNNHRLLGPLGHIPPAEYEEAYYLRLHSPRLRETLNSPGLR